jgi:hypothetical protein
MSTSRSWHGFADMHAVAESKEVAGYRRRSASAAAR